MAGTVRINRTESSPSTRFTLAADRVSSDAEANTSVVRCYLAAYNGPDGSTGSQFNGSGFQRGSIDGEGTFRTHSGDPFLPAGYSQNQKRWEDGPYNVTVEHDADGTKTAVLRMELSYGSISRNLTYNLVLPKLLAKPAAPTSVVATRSSDTQIGLVWDTNPATRAPYTSQKVLRSENGGPLTVVASLSGSAESYTAAVVANRKYTFVIQAANSAGSTNSAASNVILTTPAKLASLVGAKVSGGIKLTLSKLDVPYSECEVLVEVTTNGGGSWSAVHTFASADLSTATSTDWTHTTAPTGGTVQYRATVKTTGGTQGVLASAVTVSNVMVLNVPPLAPTGLTPSGTVDVAKPTVLAWTHTPSADGAAQSSRHIQYSVDSGATQTDIVMGDATTESYEWEIDPGDFTPGQTIQWRVRTAGSQPGTYGAWSAWQTITLQQSLSVNISSPSGTWLGGDMPVEWTSTAAWGDASQVAFRVIMATDSAQVYDSGFITSSALTHTIPADRQQNLTDYTVTVTVTDNHGLTSLPAITSVSTDYLAPGPVGLTWAYDDDLGQLVLTPEFSEETSSALDDTVSWMLERSFDGVTYATLNTYEGADPVPDPLVRIGAASWYRTTGYTALGVSGEQTVFFVPEADVRSRWGWLAYGDGFTTQVRFGWSQTMPIESGRASDVHEIEGVEFPVPAFGVQKSEKYAVSGTLLYKETPGADGIPDSWATSTASEFRTLGKTAGVCLFRDADGEYCHVRVTGMQTAKERRQSGQPDKASVSFTIERVTP